jgi:arylsulfate sulfotransferase
MSRIFITIAAFIFLIAGCGGGSGDGASGNSSQPVVTNGPTVTLDPNGITPLAAVIEMETDIPTTVVLTISDGTSMREVAFNNAATMHSLPVLGLLPNSDYSIDVQVVDVDGAGVSATDQTGPLNVITSPLPTDFPNIEVHASQPDKMEPGFTLLDKYTLRGSTGGSGEEQYSIILDSEGQVVWYSTSGGNAMKQLPNGHLSFRPGSNVVEMDMLGSIISKFELVDPGFGLHHELSTTSDGNYLSTTHDTVTFDDYPVNYTDPAPRQVAEIETDPIVEFAPNGDMHRVWRLEDILDRTRIGYYALGPFRTVGLDWAHVNAVVHDPRDNSIIVSVRHQDAVVKFDRETGALIWILGPHDGWSPEFHKYLLTPVGSDFSWQYHQHAPMLTGSGTILLFDNGNNRAVPYDGKDPVENNVNYSRGVEYDIDEDAMTVSQVWEYGSDTSPRLYAASVGDADWLPVTGNALLTFGATGYVDGVETTSLGFGTLIARVQEVTRDVSKELVFDVSLSTSDPEFGFAIYRSEHIPSLYSPDVVITE